MNNQLIHQDIVRHCQAHLPASPDLSLSTEYHQYVKQNAWDLYLHALQRDGLNWWYDMDIPRLLAHLIPLGQLNTKTLSPRIVLFKTVAQPVIDEQRVEVLYQQLLAQQDHPALAVACCAGVSSVWDAGFDLQRCHRWYQRIEQLLQHHQLPVHAQASLLGFKALVEMAVLGKLSLASDSYSQQAIFAEQAGSASLQIFAAAASAYCYYYRGDLVASELLLNDACVLCSTTNVSHVPYVYLMSSLALYNSLVDKPQTAASCLSLVTQSDWYDLLPPSVWLNGMGNLLLAQAQSGEFEESQLTAKRIQARTVPDHNAFYWGYAHYCLGIAALRQNDPQRAYHHARLAMQRGELSGSPIPKVISPLLKVQALTELQSHNEAETELEQWDQDWHDSEFSGFIALSNVEQSLLQLLQGELDSARASLQCAFDKLPPNGVLPLLSRGAKFVDQIRQQLEISDNANRPAPIEIQTFGELRIRINAGLNEQLTIYDRQWHGSKSKLLLLAIIINGGSKIPGTVLADLLWPESDGDQSHTNLKVSLSRLRKVITDKAPSLTRWLVVKQNRISLVRDYCQVDSLNFIDCISKNIASDGNNQQLGDALHRYDQDFLVKDHSQNWIIAFREQLRELFLNGCRVYAQRCLENQEPDDCLALLEKAIAVDPLNEPLYVPLIQAQLALGFPSRAMAIYQQAETRLMEAFGVKPGETLQRLRNSIISD